MTKDKPENCLGCATNISKHLRFCKACGTDIRNRLNSLFCLHRKISPYKGLSEYQQDNLLLDILLYLKFIESKYRFGTTDTIKEGMKNLELELEQGWTEYMAESILKLHYEDGKISVPYTQNRGLNNDERR